MSELRKADSIVSQNYLTDLIHIICRKTCLKDKNLWLDLLYNREEDKETQTDNAVTTTNNQESC